MNEENPVNTPEKPRRKKSRWALVAIVAIVVCGFIIALAICHPFPLNTMSVSGTVVILDENGDAIPFQPTRGTFYSHYAPDIFRGEWKRKRRVTVNQSGNFNIRVPEFNGTLILLTNDETHATVVGIRSDEPTTGLVVELRPTCSVRVRGRLLDEEGNPFADQTFSLVLYGNADMGSRVLSVWMNNIWGSGTMIGVGRMSELYSVDAITDSEGYFTMDRLIPGVEYTPVLHSPYDGSGGSLEIPVRSTYAYPYNLGDVIVRRR